MKELKVIWDEYNPHVGNIKKNYQNLKDFYKNNRGYTIDLIVFPECAISGYDSKDLFLRKEYNLEAMKYSRKLAKITKETAAIWGSQWIIDDKLYNCAIVAQNGEIIAVIPKNHLPNYKEFDDKRYFTSGGMQPPVQIKDRDGNTRTIGVMICEDGWFNDVPEFLAKMGSEFLISINASPWQIGKDLARNKIFHKTSTTTGLNLVWVNARGLQDEVWYDGTSKIYKSNTIGYYKINGLTEKTFNISKIIEACAQSLKEYMKRNGFEKAVIGLSGGADSALVALIASKTNIPLHAIMMPTQYTSKQSLKLAEDIAFSLNISYEIQNIQEIFDCYQQKLKFNMSGLALENIQAQIRGDILSAYSNTHEALILGTSNRSEGLLGYGTLYGDMRAGYNILKDVFKTEVYEMLKMYSHRYTWIEEIVSRPASAELSENQTDEKGLGATYEVLDNILSQFVDDLVPMKKIKGDKELIAKTIRKIRQSEYKRYQSAPGPMFHSNGLGSRRRMLITNSFEG